MKIKCVRGDGDVEHPNGTLEFPVIGNDIFLAKNIGRLILNKSGLTDEQITFIPPKNKELHAGMLILIHDNGMSGEYYYAIADNMELVFNGKYYMAKANIKRLAPV
jgi:hypothetical protein